MKKIVLDFYFNERLSLKKVLIDKNETELPSDSDLLEAIARCLLKSIEKNRDSLRLQDLINDIDGIGLEKE